MSLQATTWALYDATKQLDANEFRVLMIMADAADQKGRGVWLSAATLSGLCGVSSRTVRTKLASLEAKGLIVRGDQKLVEHIPANRRPIVYDLAMDGWHDGQPTENRGENISPQTADDDPDRKSGVKLDRKSGVKHGCTQTHIQGRTVEPGNHTRGRAREDDIPKWVKKRNQRIRAYQPSQEARALADHLHADIDAELINWRNNRCDGKNPVYDPDANFREWMTNGAEKNMLQRKSIPSDSRPPSTPHRHTLGCEHVLDLLAPYEHRFSHEGGRGSNPWITARSRLADQLNADTDPDTALAEILDTMPAPDLERTS